MKMSQIDKGQPNKNNQKNGGEATMVATLIFILSKNK